MFDFIVRFIGDHGYVAIFALMAVENIFPPIPSELIMPLAGFTAASGKLNLFAVLLAGTAGSVAGTVPWYYAGRLYGRKRLRTLAGNGRAAASSDATVGAPSGPGGNPTRNREFQGSSLSRSFTRNAFRSFHSSSSYRLVASTPRPIDAWRTSYALKSSFHKI